MVLYSNPKWLSGAVKITRPVVGMGVKPDGLHRIRLRIYSIESEENLLSNLLHDNVILAPKKAGWLNINIESYQLQLPKEGFIVAMA